MVKTGEKTKWADFLLWVNILLRFPPVKIKKEKKVSGCGKDTKKMYKLVSNITGVHKDNPLPDSESNQDFADKFADYFMEKINTIRDALKDKHSYQPTCRDAPELNSFNPVAEDEVTKYIKKLATKSCELDSIPTKLLKENY